MVYYNPKEYIHPEIKLEFNYQGQKAYYLTLM